MAPNGHKSRIATFSKNIHKSLIQNELPPNTGSLGAGSGVSWPWPLAALYHGYRQIRNRKVNEALIQGVETARAVLETTL